ncbi:MAG: CoA transferase [Gammaproteobacteria bacterium]|nr:MAG: CoA transferase [Gammaproteobacteria bacterium]
MEEERGSAECSGRAGAGAPDTSGTPPLSGYRIVDLSSGIGGGYCTKLLVDAGATVVKLEPPEGDPLRRWTASGYPLGDAEDGALFRFLAAGKRSVVIDPDDPACREQAHAVLAGADAIVWSPGSRLAGNPDLKPAALRATLPGAIVTSITPFGLAGPWANRPSSDLVLQALSGGPAIRGLPDRPPVSCGGQPSEWVAGSFAALGTLAARYRAWTTGSGELLDVSMFESLLLTQDLYPVTYFSIAGRPWRGGKSPSIPGIEPTADGYIGLAVATSQHWHDFCVLIGQPDWAADESLYSYKGRWARWADLMPAIQEATRTRTTAELLETAALLRLPVAPVGNGATIPHFDHFAERGDYVRNPTGGFLQPGVPYRLSAGAAPRPFGPAPRLGELDPRDVSGRSVWPKREAIAAPVPGAADGGAADRSLPFRGLRVLEFTSFWAGPLVGQFFAMLGAEVIHVESTAHPDGFRSNTLRAVSDDLWWEWSPAFLGANTNKRDLTLDLQRDAGRDIARQLTSCCDLVLDNFSPRVLEQWGLDYASLSRDHPGLIMLRMPAFGLNGPWRDRIGFAYTMEQVSGLAWVTGEPDEPPLTPNGICDAMAGVHATFAAMLGLEHRRRTGKGMFIEVPMVGSALNMAAEQVVEYSAYGRLLQRTGNRSPAAAPQNIYRCAADAGNGSRECWIAIAVCSDSQWQALRQAIGDPAWARDDRLRSTAGRRTAQDQIDAKLAAWCVERAAAETAEQLCAAGVPAAAVVLPYETRLNPQLQARGFFEPLQHPVVGPVLHEGYPVHFSGGPERFHRAPAPTLGEHNREILSSLLRMTEAEIEELATRGVIGNRPAGQHRAR